MASIILSILAIANAITVIINIRSVKRLRVLSKRLEDLISKRVSSSRSSVRSNRLSSFKVPNDSRYS